jgi:tRNA A37 threonylcarbamoyltransferase TsaD
VRLSADGEATVLSSVVHSQIDDDAAYGAVVPEIAARSHVVMIDGVVRRASSWPHVPLPRHVWPRPWQYGPGG